MMKIFPHNPIYIVIISLTCPWRLRNTYIYIEGSNITFSRYYANRQIGLEKCIATFGIDNIQRIGFPKYLNIKMKKAQLNGSRGNYVSQEIDFETNTEIIPLNARPYTKKQIRFIIRHITNLNNKVIIGRSLSKELRLGC